MKRLLDIDMGTMEGFCRFFAPGQVRYLEELHRQFLLEFDFVAEAEDLALVGRNMRRFRRSLRLPRVLPEYCGEAIVAMEHLEGPTLLDYSNAWAARLERLPKPLALLPALLLRRKALQALDTLLLAHGWQVLMDGVFNGDPHPGNILMCPDGRLGLIDYGQVKHLSDAARLGLARMVVALAHDDRDSTVKEAVVIGFRTEHMDPDVIFRQAQVWFDRDDDVGE